MVKCPVCKKEISELDESCPYCHTIFDDMTESDDMTEEISETERKTENYEKEIYDKKRTNADCLNFIANINIILSIIGAILIWVNFGTAEITHKSTYFSNGYTETIANWYGIFGGVAVLIAGFTLYFLLKTIVDIYWETEKQ